MRVRPELGDLILDVVGAENIEFGPHRQLPADIRLNERPDRLAVGDQESDARPMSRGGRKPAQALVPVPARRPDRLIDVVKLVAIQQKTEVVRRHTEIGAARRNEPPKLPINALLRLQHRERAGPEALQQHGLVQSATIALGS